MTNDVSISSRLSAVYERVSHLQCFVIISYITRNSDVYDDIVIILECVIINDICRLHTSYPICHCGIIFTDRFRVIGSHCDGADVRGDAFPRHFVVICTVNIFMLC